MKKLKKLNLEMLKLSDAELKTIVGGEYEPGASWQTGSTTDNYQFTYYDDGNGGTTRALDNYRSRDYVTDYYT